MNVHEYQAKKILKHFHVPITPFGVASNLEEVKLVLDSLNLQKAVLKVQVHAGGRGKAGGIQMAQNREEALEKAKKLLGMKIVNNQTGPKGVIAHKIMITEPCEIEKEYYASIIMDRVQKCPLMILSPEGGMDIEEVAVKHPEKILSLPLYPEGRLKPFQLLYAAKFLGLKGDLIAKASALFKGMAEAFWATDASLLEINPLILSKGELIALDAKLSIDDNALYRQKEIQTFYDETQVSPLEAQAQKHELAYIALEGDIACMVNGAGLAMATMDIIQHFGGRPANFLDVGGGSSKEKVTEGFRIILSDPAIKAILVNIFGGIMNCATIAEGLIEAAKTLQIQVPLIVRLEGTNAIVGRKLLKESGLKITSAEGLGEAAKLAVEAAKKG